MKLHTVKGFVLFALLGMLLALCVAGWLWQNRQPPASATDSAIGTDLPENAPLYFARTVEISARVTRVAPPRNSMLDAAGEAASSSEPTPRAESFDPAAAVAWIAIVGAGERPDRRHHRPWPSDSGSAATKGIGNRDRIA